MPDKKEKKLSYKERTGHTRVGDILRGIKGVAPEILTVLSAIPGLQGLNTVKGLIKETTTMSEAEKEIALKELDKDIAEEIELTKRWEADVHSDSWLSKNIRPLVLLYLVLFVTTTAILDSSLESFDMKEHWVTLFSSLLLTTIGAYFGLREVGKFVSKKYKK